MIRLLRTLWTLTLIIPFLLSMTAVAAEERSPAGTVALETTSVAAGIGVQWGDGILTFNGKQYPFSLQGLEVVGVGFSKVTATGTVYNLTKVSDFEGVYAAAEAGMAAGEGPATVAMRNPNGVVIHLHSAQEGVKLTLAAEGVNVELKEKEPVS